MKTFLIILIPFRIFQSEVERSEKVLAVTMERTDTTPIDETAADDRSLGPEETRTAEKGRAPTDRERPEREMVDRL
jgi:hypothetical protein